MGSCEGTADSDFVKPGPMCFTVGMEEARAFFGHDVTVAHGHSPEFHSRAAYFPYAKASSSDLRRAKQPKPGRAFQGEGFATAMQLLNDVLENDEGLATKLCQDFDMLELQA